VTKAREETEAEAKAARETADGEASKQIDSALEQLHKELAIPERRLLFSTHKPERVAGAVEVFLKSLGHWADCVSDASKWQILADTFKQMDERLRGYRDNARRLKEHFERTRERVVERQHAIRARLEDGSNRYQLEFEALDAADVDRLASGLWIQTLAESVAQAVVEEIALLGLDSKIITLWGSRIIERIDDAVRKSLGARGLFEILRYIHGNDDKGIERQLKKLFEYAAPFWHLTLTNCPEAMEWSAISLVGYEGASRATGGGYFEKVLQKVVDLCTPVEIYQPNRVIVLNTKHGVPVLALSVTNGMMRDAYYLYRTGWLEGRPGFRPVHLSQAWMEQLPDFNPATPPGQP
jgi:hypothetical protein